MSQEIWHYVIPIITAGIGVIIDRSISFIFRTKFQKKKERVDSEMLDHQVEEKEMAVERDRADRAWRRAETLEDKYDKLIIEIDRLKEEAIAAKLEAIEERKARIAAEEQRDLFHGLLGKLVKLVLTSCPGIDISEYEEAIRT